MRRAPGTGRRSAHRAAVAPHNRGLLEDDPYYARGLEALAHRFYPTAVSLDVFLPDMLGWMVLSQLKQDPATRHIPV